MTLSQNGPELFCPVCRRQLKATCEGYYETLDEHVCDPNSAPTKRTGYTCINNICVAHTLGAVWIYNGEGPYDIPYYKYGIVKKASVNSIDHPFGSYWRKIKAEERVKLVSEMLHPIYCQSIWDN